MEYETEEQQVEALKKWWAENGRSVILGVGIGVAAIGGWQLWNKHTVSQSRQASDWYEQTIRAMSGEGDVGELAKKVRDDHDDSLYASLAAMAAARGYVEQGKLEEAGKELSWTASNAPDKQVALIARIRLARVQSALGKPEEALKTLPKKAPESFTALVEEVRGDLYVATGDMDKALTAYQAALDSGQNVSNSQVLTMKINELATAADAS